MEDKKEYEPEWFKELAILEFNESNLHMASGWVNFDKSNYDLFVRKQINMVNVTSGDNVLEIGCGIGAFLQILNTYTDQITGIDINEVILKTAKKYNPTAKLFRCDATELQFDDESFDVVLMPAVLGYIDTDKHDLILREIKRVLKPGGRCMIGLLAEDEQYLLTMKSVVSKKYWDHIQNVNIQDLNTWNLDDCDHIEGRYAVSFTV